MGLLGGYPDDSTTTASDKYLTYDASGATKLTPASTLAAYILADLSVTTAKLAAASVTNAKLATGAGEPGGAWNSWTPSFTNWTAGNGTVVAKYKQVGKTIEFHLRFTFGSSSAMGTTPNFSLPIPASSDYNSLLTPIGICTFEDAGTAFYYGMATMLTTTTARIIAQAASGTWVSEANITASAPFVWTTGDVVRITGSYEAA